jgi:hypothetical protein
MLRSRMAVAFVVLLSAFSVELNGQAQKKTDPVVYVTRTGKKYHAKSCRTLHRSKTVTPMRQSEAEKKGYAACERC